MESERTKMSFFNLLNSKIMIVIIGFILTTVFGNFIANQIQNANWKNRTKVALYQSRYEEGKLFLDDLSEQIGHRYYLLQRLLWGKKSNDSIKIIEREKLYFESVVEWNSKIWYNRNKIRLLIGEDEAKMFLDYHDDIRGNDPQSIHYKFSRTHAAVMEAKSQKEFKDAQLKVERLNHSCSVYLERLTNRFLIRAANLELLDMKKMNKN